MNFRQMFVVLVAMLGLTGFALAKEAVELYGYGTVSEREYRVMNNEGKKVFSVPEGDVNAALLLDGHGVVQDRFRRVTWFESDGKTIATSIPGVQFRLSDSFLATYTIGGIAQVMDRSGKVVFQQLNRAVAGVAVAKNRFAVLDQWDQRLSVYNQDGGVIFTRSFVVRAWLSDSFVGVTTTTGELLLFGADFKLLQTESNPNQLQLSNDLAVITSKSGSIRVLSPSRVVFAQSSQDAQITLTANYLAISDRFGTEIFRKDGSYLTRYNAGLKIQFGEKAFGVRQITGSVVVQDPTQEQSGRFMMINRADRFAIGSHLVLAQNGAFFEVYSLDAGKFGSLVASGVGLADSGVQGKVGLRAFGFIYPNAKSARVFDQNGKVLLDQTFVSRIDLSVEGDVLNWSAF